MTGLLSEFPPVSNEQWKAAIEKDLKGGDPKKLLWTTEDGIVVQPYYRSDSKVAGQPPVWQRNGSRWEIRAEVTAAEPTGANEQARRAIERGASGIEFRGVRISTIADLRALLEGLPLERISVHFQCGADSSQVLELLERLPNSAQIAGSVACDPIAEMAEAGKVDADKLTEAAVRFQNALRTLPKVTPLVVGTALYHNAGASAAQELAIAMSAGAEYLAQFTERSIAAADVIANMAFAFDIGSSYFLEIAKLRAARLLWRSVAAVFDGGAADLPMRINARTSEWNLAMFDPHVNLLRGTTEAMAAILGGANSLTVAPFTGAWRESDEMSMRLALNTQFILRDEASFDKVSDPGAGSWYLEELTDSLARKAWALFQEFESEGGFLEALSKGLIQNMVRANRENRELLIAERKKAFVGVNAYPNSKEQLDIEAPKENGTGAFPATRGPKMYEKLRLAAEHAPKRPKVLLVLAGDKKMRRARADFSTNFFACGGFEVVEGGLGSAPDADLIVLCSSDPEYPALAAEICPKATAPVIVAGLPKDSLEQLRAAGVKDFIHIRSNTLQVLTDWHQKLGLKN